MFIRLDRHWRQRWRLGLFWVVKVMLLELGEDRRVGAGLFTRCLQEAGFGLLRCLLPAVAACLGCEIVLVGDIFVFGAFGRHKARYTRALGWRLVKRERLKRRWQLADAGLR